MFLNSAKFIELLKKNNDCGLFTCQFKFPVSFTIILWWLVTHLKMYFTFYKMLLSNIFNIKCKNDHLHEILTSSISHLY